MNFEKTPTSNPEEKKEKESIPVIEAGKWLRFSGPPEQDNVEFQKFLGEKGIELNTGIQKVWIEGGQVEIFTDEERFGSIVENSDMIFEK